MKRRTAFVLLIAALILTGCASEGDPAADASALVEPEKVEFFAMDTYMTISAYGEGAGLPLAEAEAKILELESLWSVSDEGSEISLLNKAGYAEISPDTASIIETAMRVSADTGHTFDVTIYPLVKAWGFTADTYRIPGDDELDYLKTLVNSDRIVQNGDMVALEDSMALDFGAIAKGYASEAAVSILRERGISSALMSLGGNVQSLGAKPDGSLWNIAIQDPKNPQKYAGAIKIADKAVVTSGTYQRYFERDGAVYHHLIDPSTGRPADNGLLSVTIISDSGTLADALSTAVFIMGVETAVDFWRSGTYNFEMILISDDGSVRITEGIADTFTSGGDGVNLPEVVARAAPRL